jgi:hypothetical protein
MKDNRLLELEGRALTYLANAITLLEEEEYDKESIIEQVGITSEQYEYIMYNDFDN